MLGAPAPGAGRPPGDSRGAPAGLGLKVGLAPRVTMLGSLSFKPFATLSDSDSEMSLTQSAWCVQTCGEPAEQGPGRGPGQVGSHFCRYMSPPRGGFFGASSLFINTVLRTNLTSSINLCIFTRRAVRT